MQNAFFKMYIQTRIILNAIKREDGQDLIEYALTVALVALAATAGMNALANGINTAFSNIAGALNATIV